MNVIELYSGIGGMHFALKESGIDYKVVKAVDINTTANEVYKLNFPKTLLLGKNIQSLQLEDFNGIDMILMSPPCQPHTRNGLKRDNLDERSHSLLYLLTLLPKLHSVNYILLENVKGFEISRIRDELVDILISSGYTYQEFLLTPTQFGIPNSRLSDGVENEIINLQTNLETDFVQCYPLKEILDEMRVINLVVLLKVMDILLREPVPFCHRKPPAMYFTPKEISKLMCFPDSLIFPNYFTKKQKYRLLGNSVNVHVVSILIKLLVS
ncbi:Modification methylase HaeIII, putative [Pediculus humanus corporis]|uniref:tRNA (cytosine(38)-C(5))-methyltransferase n=1 Tax=Pediculus humanus subsp. corporis TaxID=121224 RepID=E0W2G1_PEDHC|nr:Modification methylase HaeIII, putative [Pediculus humanus corporis]EEB19817.1 Modification methylase HaeIII, putative [Pediculus humanus corporis]